jgi:hypothetical protein
MITELATLVKPCAFGALQAASGLDQRRQLGDGAAVSSMPHCRVARAAKSPPLTRGASSPAQVRSSVRLVASVAWPLATAVAKRTQRLLGVWD